MEAGESLDRIATPEDVCQAFEALSDMELVRLRKIALVHMPGSVYASPDEIINEAICRTLNAANGGKGRRWPKDVPFFAYLTQVIRGLGSDSRESEHQSKTVRLEAMAPEGATTEDVLGFLEHYHPDALSNAIEIEADQERETRAKADLDRIDAHFAGDSQVTWLILGIKDGLSVAEIKELSDMTQTQYDTAMRRFRRGKEKIFSEKRPS